MHTGTLLLLGLLSVGTTEYARSLGAKSLDQAALDAEGFGEKKSFKREADGLRVTLGPREQETGWRTPPQVRFGGDFTISAEFVIKKLPKPAQEDGAAIGLAIAFGDINQPDVTLVRLVEPNGTEVYRSIEKAMGGPQQMQGPMMMRGRAMGMVMMGGPQPGGKPPKPPRRTFPAAGDTVRLELQREGQTIRFQVLDARSTRPRYLGQVQLGPMDVAAVKLFVSNRNGAEAANVLLRNLTIHAQRVNGLGTEVHTVFGEIVYAEPTSIEKDILIVGGPPKAPPAQGGTSPQRMAAALLAPALAAVLAPPPAVATLLAPALAAAAGATPTAPKAGTVAAGPTPAAPAATPAPAAMPVAAAAPAPAPAGPVAMAVPGGVVVVAPAGPAPAPPPGAMAVAPMPGPAMPGPARAGGRAANAPQQPGPPKPQVKIPLDEVESIRFERTPSLTARLVGQPNLDFTMPGLSAKKEDEAPKTEAKKDDTTAKKAETKKADATPMKAEAKKDEPKKPAAEKPAPAAKKDEPKKTEEKKAEAKKTEAKKTEPAAKKDEPKKTEEKKAEVKKTEAVAKKAETKKDEPKKPEETDDALAPPPGTTITKYPKVEPKKNGIRDLQLALFGLRPAKIRQVMVNCQTDKGPASWRLDTSDSQDWPLVIHRAGTELSADLFLEPPPGDCFQKNFTININYEDGQAANANIQADKHSDPKLAVDPKAPAVEPTDAWVYLTGDEKLFGKLGRVNQEKETLHLTTPWQDQLEIPLARVVGIHFGLLDRKETPESFAKRLKSRGSEDLLLAQTKKGEVIAIPGVAEGTEEDRLRFRYQGRTRTLPLKQVEGLVMANRPESQPEELRPTFSLPGGVTVSGRWKDLDPSTWKVETPWGQELKLPAAEVQGVRFRGGKMTYLSDLNPSKVEETPFFGHRFPWRRNVNLLGDPLKMNGETYERGVAVHSRCVLTYDLNGRFATFEALVGFDDAVKGKGRVDCRVFADTKPIYANPDLRADGPPVKLSLPVAGAEQLRLQVDFGHGQDTGDRVIWANARLYRQTASKAPVSTTASRQDPSAERR